MKRYYFLLFCLLTMACSSPSTSDQSAPTPKLHLTISPQINQERYAPIIEPLRLFLQSKNSSNSGNAFWKQDEFEQYIYPYHILYLIERKGDLPYYYQPTLLNIIDTENPNQKLVKLAYIGNDSIQQNRELKCIFNIMAHDVNGTIYFGKALPYFTKNWKEEQIGLIHYYISPQKAFNREEAILQQEKVRELCSFFDTTPIPITYYSCVNTKELFTIRGYDYHPKMFSRITGGLTSYGNLVFSGGNSEEYTHEIVHIYQNKLYPNAPLLLHEGIATYLGGSSKKPYQWHRDKLKAYLLENPDLDFTQYTEAYANQYIDEHTSIPYIVGAMLCDHIIRVYGKEKLFELFAMKKGIWETLQEIGVRKNNFNAFIHQELAQ